MPMVSLHTIESAPEGRRALLRSSIDNFGWIPNRSAHMACSPCLLDAYQRGHDLFIRSSLDGPVESRERGITLFRSVGLAVHDLVFAREVIRRRVQAR